MKTILVLGGDGFIGSNILNYFDNHLSDSYNVILFNKFENHPKIKYHYIKDLICYK